MKRAGTITLICGGMFSGKSEELIRRARRALYAKKKVQVFKPSIDRRYDEAKVVSHEGARHEAVPVASVAELESLLQKGTQLVLVEEAQFFDEAITELVTRLADSGIDVVLAGCDQDFRRKPFGPMAELLVAADEIVKLRAICIKCGQTASHNQRIIDGRPAHKDDPVVLIGATDAYEARCRCCFELRGARRARPGSAKRGR